MITNTVPQNHVPDIDESEPWIGATEPPEADHATRTTFRSVVAEWAAKARAKLPKEINGRLEAATKLVLQHDVLILDDGSAEVGSSSDPMKVYRVRGRTCECQDHVHGRAPEGLCQHVIAAALMQRVTQQVQKQAPQTDEAPVPAPEPEHHEAVATGKRVIPSHFIQQLQGRPFVKYVGLLQMAHEAGLTTLTEEWTYNDPELSLAHAVAVFQDGRTFAGSGDSTPQNAKNIGLAWRRMSLTRAKARALRDGLGIDMAAVEEME
jgi:hypothetical protein